MIKVKVTLQLEALLRENVFVLDCTSAARPASIVFYELAQQHLVPLIYVYEQDNSLKWLISRETIMNQLGIEKE